MSCVGFSNREYTACAICYMSGVTEHFLLLGEGVNLRLTPSPKPRPVTKTVSSSSIKFVEYTVENNCGIKA